MKNSNSATTLLVGIIIGIFGGFLIGAFFGKSIFQLASVLIQVLSKGDKADKDRMKFELLLQ